MIAQTSLRQQCIKDILFAASQGYDLIPLRAMGKRPIYRQWQRNPIHPPASPDRAWAEEQYKQHWEPHGSTNIGILAATTPCLDVDIDRVMGIHWPGVATLHKICHELLGATTPIRTGQPPSVLLPFINTNRGSVRKKVLTLYHEGNRVARIEVLGEGQQWMAFGVHPSGRRIEWSTLPHRHLLARVDREELLDELILELQLTFDEKHELRIKRRYDPSATLKAYRAGKVKPPPEKQAQEEALHKASACRHVQGYTLSDLKHILDRVYQKCVDDLDPHGFTNTREGWRVGVGFAISFETCLTGDRSDMGLRAWQYWSRKKPVGSNKTYPNSDEDCAREWPAMIERLREMAKAGETLRTMHTLLADSGLLDPAVGPEVNVHPDFVLEADTSTMHWAKDSRREKHRGRCEDFTLKDLDMKRVDDVGRFGLLCHWLRKQVPDGAGNTAIVGGAAEMVSALCHHNYVLASPGPASTGYVTRYTPLNTVSAVVMPSGAGKGVMLSRIQAAIDNTIGSSVNLIIGDTSSGQAIRRRLADDVDGAVSLHIDEFAEKITKGGERFSIAPILKALTGSAPLMICRLGIKADNKHYPPVPYPYLTFFGLSTPERMLELAGDAQLKDGFINRFIFYGTIDDTDVQLTRDEKLQKTAKALADWQKARTGAVSAPRVAHDNNWLREIWDAPPITAVGGSSPRLMTKRTWLLSHKQDVNQHQYAWEGMEANLLMNLPMHRPTYAMLGNVGSTPGAEGRYALAVRLDEQAMQKLIQLRSILDNLEDQRTLYRDLYESELTWDRMPVPYRSRQGLIPALWSRTEEHTLRLASIIAVCDKPNCPIVTAPMLLFALNVVARSVYYSEYCAFKRRGMESTTVELVDAIIQFVCDGVPLTELRTICSEHEAAAATEMHRRGFVPMKLIERHFSQEIKRVGITRWRKEVMPSLTFPAFGLRAATLTAPSYPSGKPGREFPGLMKTS